jgi:hypothetical protein
MAKQKARAVEKQLHRALKQREWLKKNLPNSKQLRACEKEILVKRTTLLGKLQIFDLLEAKSYERGLCEV